MRPVYVASSPPGLPIQIGVVGQASEALSSTTSTDGSGPHENTLAVALVVVMATCCLGVCSVIGCCTCWLCRRNSHEKETFRSLKHGEQLGSTDALDEKSDGTASHRRPSRTHRARTNPSALASHAKGSDNCLFTQHAERSDEQSSSAARWQQHMNGTNGGSGGSSGGWGSTGRMRTSAIERARAHVNKGQRGNELKTFKSSDSFSSLREIDEVSAQGTKSPEEHEPVTPSVAKARARALIAPPPSSSPPALAKGASGPKLVSTQI